jgi:EmrB/QacA subfamily drug resistance transporter
MAIAEPTPCRDVTRREVRLTFMGLVLSMALGSLDQSIVSTALPRIVSDLGGLAHLSWVVTAFMLTSTVSTLLYGKLSDIYGRKRLYYIGITTFLIGSMLCGMARSMLQLIIWRGAQGLGAGGLIALAHTTIGDLIPPRHRGKYQGYFSIVFATSSIAGPILGGMITDFISWRWVFYVNLPIGLLALLLIGMGLRHKGRPVNHRVDVTGAILLTGSTSCLLLLLNWGGSVYPWSSSPIAWLALGSVVLGGTLIFVEARASEPNLPLTLFANPIFSVCIGGFFFTGMALMGGLLFMPLFFQLVEGIGPSKAGLLMIPMTIGNITAAIVGGRLVSATGRYKMIPLLGLTTAGIFFWVISYLVHSGASVLAVEIALLFLGLGFGSVMSILTVAVQNAVARRDIGVATSIASFFRSLGCSVGVSVAGSVMLVSLIPRLPTSLGGHIESPRVLLQRGAAVFSRLPGVDHRLTLSAYRHAIAATFLFSGFVAISGAFTIYFLREKRLRDAHYREEAPELVMSEYSSPSFMRPHVGNGSEGLRGGGASQSSHSTHCRSRNQAGS